MLKILRYFAIVEKLPKFSEFLDRKDVSTVGFEKCLHEYYAGAEQYVQFLAYCLMPTHIHLALKQLQDNGISIFMSNIANSYARYFNTRHKRKGPLWVGKFKSVHIETDKQLLHLTRYLHLNPTTAELVQAPENWHWSSYPEYIDPHQTKYPLCQFEEMISMTPRQYKSFVDNHKHYQHELGKIKKLVLE